VTLCHKVGATCDRTRATASAHHPTATVPGVAVSQQDPALVRALVALYDGAVDRLLASDERVTSARQGKAIIAGDDDAEELADRIQRVAVLAVPVVRTLARGARFTRVPWVLVASTVASTTLTIRAGVREVQTIASFLAYRIEQQTQAPADPVLVKKLTLELYLSPRSTPDLTGTRLSLLRLLRRWLWRGALGRDTGRQAAKALDAVERLDVASVVARWHDHGAAPYVRGR
jgi:hypothetical protein